MATGRPQWIYVLHTLGIALLLASTQIWGALFLFVLFAYAMVEEIEAFCSWEERTEQLDRHKKEIAKIKGGKIGGHLYSLPTIEPWRLEDAHDENYTGAKLKGSCIWGCGCYITIDEASGPLGIDPYGYCPYREGFRDNLGFVRLLELNKKLYKKFPPSPEPFILTSP